MADLSSGRQVKVHTLKCWPEPYQATIEGRKRFEYRRNDRDFNVGDFIELQEWNPGITMVTDAGPVLDASLRGFTGRRTTLKISYILRGGDWGIPSDFDILSTEAAV